MRYPQGGRRRLCAQLPTGECCAQTSDKAVLEEFEEPADDRAAVTEVVSRAVSPANEVGGDARLILPDERRIKSKVAEHDGLVSGYSSHLG